MTRELVAEFTVLGEAKTAGSKKAFVNPKTGRAIVTDDTGPVGKAWRSDVRDAAMPSFEEPTDGPLAVEILFIRARPKGHYGAGGNVRPGAPRMPVVRPDVDKLSRAVLDALTGVAWHDDSQVVTKLVAKRYARSDRTVVRIWREAGEPEELPVMPAQLDLDLGGSSGYHCGHGDDERAREAVAV